MLWDLGWWLTGKAGSWGRALLSLIKPREKRTFLDEITSRRNKETNKQTNKQKREWASEIPSQGGCDCEATTGKACYVWPWAPWGHGLFCCCSLFGISHLGGLCNSAGPVYVLSGTFCHQQAGRLLWTEAMQSCPSPCPHSVLASGHSLWPQL